MRILFEGWLCACSSSICKIKNQMQKTWYSEERGSESLHFNEVTYFRAENVCPVEFRSLKQTNFLVAQILIERELQHTWSFFPQKFLPSSRLQIRANIKCYALSGASFCNLSLSTFNMSLYVRVFVIYPCLLLIRHYMYAILKYAL